MLSPAIAHTAPAVRSCTTHRIRQLAPVCTRGSRRPRRISRRALHHEQALLDVVAPAVRSCTTHRIRQLVPVLVHAKRTAIRSAIGNESAPIQLAQCRFPGLAIFNAKM